MMKVMNMVNMKKMRNIALMQRWTDELDENYEQEKHETDEDNYESNAHYEKVLN